MMFDPDYIGGLRKMMETLDADTRMGYYDNFQEDVLIVLKPEHVSEAPSTYACSAPYHERRVIRIL